MSGPVLIGFDGSETAERAVRAAAEVISLRTALVVAVYEAAIAFQGNYAGLDVQAVPIDLQAAAAVDEALYENARLRAAHGAELMRGLGFAAEPLVAAGDVSAGATLVRLARERDASLIVVGSHRYGRVERMLVGSTSRHVLEHAPCPVLLVRAAED